MKRDISRSRANRYWSGAVVIVLNATIPSADAAEQFVPFEGLKTQFTIALPSGWHAYDQSEAIAALLRSESSALPEEPSPFGVVIFSAQPLTKPGEKTADPDLLAQADTGRIPSFFVDRQPAGNGMTCAEFSRPAGGRVANMARSDSVISEGQLVPTQFLPKQIVLGGCQGFRILLGAKHRKPVKVEWVYDIRAISDGKVLYLFTLRALAEHYEAVVGTFENALATVKLSAAP